MNNYLPHTPAEALCAFLCLALFIGWLANNGTL